MKKLLLIPALCGILLLTWCSQQSQKDTIMCTYNDDPVMEQQVRKHYEKLIVQEIQDKYQNRCNKKMKAQDAEQTLTLSWVIKDVKSIQASWYDTITGGF